MARVPPEKTSKSERRGLPRKSAVRLFLSIPAAGMWAAILNTKRARATTRIFFLNLGSVTAFLKNWAIYENINL